MQHLGRGPTAARHGAPPPQRWRAAHGVARPRCTPSRRGGAAVHASVVWRQLEETGAWVCHARAARRPRALVHFLGGAFAGAAPQVAYHLNIELLAEAGFTVIATPYQLTFKHLDCARSVAASFRAAVAELRASGRAYLAPPGSAVVGVGHSNGALLHLLVGAAAPGHARANVLVSFNNKQVSDAIPIPGFLDGLGPTVRAARAAGAAGAASDGSSSSGSGAPPPAAARLLASAAAALPPGVAVERRLIEAALPAVDQIGSVFGEVGDGVTEFTPTPAESRDLIYEGYAIPRSLFVRFEDDSIDETPEMVSLLRAAAAADSLAAGDGSGYLSAGPGSASSGDWDGGGGSAESSGSDLNSIAPAGEGRRRRRAAGALEVSELLLPGSHITPCGSGIDVGPLAAGPLQQAVLDGQADVRRLAAEVTAWILAALEADRRAGGAGAGSAAGSRATSAAGSAAASVDGGEGGNSAAAVGAQRGAAAAAAAAVAEQL